MLRNLLTVRFALIVAVLALVAVLAGDMPWGPA
jgi:hypothetical protein